MSNIINSKITIHLISFLIIIVLIDALNLLDEYKLLEIKYNDSQKIQIKLTNDLKEINFKFDIFLSKIKNKKDYNINVQYKDANKPKDDLNSFCLFKSNSFTFKNKKTIF